MASSGSALLGLARLSSGLEPKSSLGEEGAAAAASGRLSRPLVPLALRDAEQAVVGAGGDDNDKAQDVERARGVVEGDGPERDDQHLRTRVQWKGASPCGAVRCSEGR